jgi:dethiobiotin synthetase
VSVPLLDVFVTGTETGVGKTHACAQIARAALRQKLVPGMLKPVQVGPVDDARTVAEEAPGTVAATVYRFRAALSPAASARLEHKPAVEVEHVLEAAEELRAATAGIIVEGSGGLLEPLNDEQTTADLAVALGLPLLIVCRPTTGAVNHVALTLETARRRGLQIAGIVINGAHSKPDLAERTTRAELGRMAVVVGVYPQAESVIQV